MFLQRTRSVSNQWFPVRTLFWEAGVKGIPENMKNINKATVDTLFQSIYFSGLQHAV